MDLIPSETLQPADIPADDATLTELIAFAHSFDGYRACGSLEQCALIANAKDHSSLDNLRVCLFFEARRWRHYGEDPHAEALAYWRQVVSKIRQIVEERASA